MDQVAGFSVAAPGLVVGSGGGVDPADNAGPKIQFVSFAIGDEQYGIDIMAVREIKGWAAITRLPEKPEYYRGVLSLRGVIVPIIDLRCRFGEGLTDPTGLHVVIIVQIADQQVGLLADRVLDIISFNQSQVQVVPNVERVSQARFLSGLVTIEGVMVALIDLPNLLPKASDSIEPEAAIH
jgi:purine-binding chemotaxis protein CheW